VGTEGQGLCKAVLFAYSIWFLIVLALQHNIHICNTLGHFLDFRLGQVEVVHLAIHHLPNRQMQLADAV
jgi:hypothetical protein